VPRPSLIESYQPCRRERDLPLSATSGLLVLQRLTQGVYVVGVALLKEGQALKKGQLELAAHYGGPAGHDKLALGEWTMGRRVPLLLESLAWFECQLVSEHPAGDHVLVLGK
jgi:flavin reductase (DIM6/NTAB) family NADH-FMN oxidoreductase RutF